MVWIVNSEWLAIFDDNNINDKRKQNTYHNMQKPNEQYKFDMVDMIWKKNHHNKCWISISISICSIEQERQHQHYQQ